MGGFDLDGRVEAVRRFNRFWTRRIGVLEEGYLRSPFSLAEARVLYELFHRERGTASGLGEELGLDAGYLSRILRRLQERGLVSRTPSETDRRRSVLRLTGEGREVFGPLEARSREGIGELLQSLSPEEQDRVVRGMEDIEGLLGVRPEPKVPYLLRSPRPGDMGWIAHRHGVLYAREYGWDERFEALVAGIVASFIQDQDSERERCWIAERKGEIVGSVFLVNESEAVAKLRLLFVEPSARGLGIGTRLVEECIDFARAAGYRKITLWTNSVLHAARHIYKRAGFTLVREEPHNSYGHDLVGETWELEL